MGLQRPGPDQRVCLCEVCPERQGPGGPGHTVVSGTRERPTLLWGRWVGTPASPLIFFGSLDDVDTLGSCLVWERHRVKHASPAETRCRDKCQKQKECSAQGWRSAGDVKHLEIPVPLGFPQNFPEWPQKRRRSPELCCQGKRRKGSEEKWQSWI